MRRLTTPVLLAGLLVSHPLAVTAQTNLTSVQQFGPASTVLYLPFHVSVGGTFNIETFGPNNIDPMIRLFGGFAQDGPSLGAQLAVNDDGAPASSGWNACTGPGGTCNSLISLFLGTGSYTVATSVWFFAEAEARAGTADFVDPRAAYCNRDGDWSDCSYSLSLSSTSGVATVSVPEPGSGALLLTGLFGLLFVGRKSRIDLS